MNRLVLDSSFALAWCFDDEASPRTDDVLARADQLTFVIPALWRWEIANVLLMSEKRGRIHPDKTAQMLLRLNRLSFSFDDGSIAIPLQELVDLARNHKLTSYDAAYLELALRLQLPLATLDGPLATAAKASGIVVI